MISLYEWVVENPHFTLGCTIVAFFLFVTSKPEYKVCLGVLFLEFALCKIAAVIGLDLTRMWSQWELYAIYGLIQMCALLSLFVILYININISIMIALLIAFAGLYNIELALSWQKQGLTGYSAKYLYESYKNLFGGIMFFQLFFMFLCSKWWRLRRSSRGDTYSRAFEVMFCVYPRANLRHSVYVGDNA